MGRPALAIRVTANVLRGRESPVTHVDAEVGYFLRLKRNAEVELWG
jgi:hypothetical protein